ncbi:MAG: hypothetical protein IMF16_02915 [Proteobacteria bacterium]|nr:hypothetical protein [Pseudomonadota bacterium]
MISIESLSAVLGKVSGAFVALLYAVFSFTDLLLTRAAFSLGVGEANPMLSWLDGHGLFVPAKVVFTLVAALLMGFLYSRGRARAIAWSALLLMVSVVGYHLWGLGVA